ncbi:MAG TPA: hypothetical protein VHJ58_06725 [Vicinamibacterales bacterium]|nr:hypothetical protein [Vicinamibacterales bacterium]
MSARDLAQDAATEAVVTALASHVDAASSEVAPTGQDAEARAWGEHPPNLRITVFGRYYVTIVSGKERRSVDRRIAERQNHRLNTRGNTLVALAFSTAVGLALYGLLMTLGLWWLNRFLAP